MNDFPNARRSAAAYHAEQAARHLNAAYWCCPLDEGTANYLHKRALENVEKLAQILGFDLTPIAEAISSCEPSEAEQGLIPIPAGYAEQ